MISSQQKARLTWHCRRGMLELDLILQRFLKQQVDALTDTQIASFEQLLASEDPDLYAWLMGYESPVNEASREIIAFIQRCDNTR